MASDLTITIQESITLPNGNKEILQNQIVISDINQTMRRVDTISTQFSGSGIEILRFVGSEEEQTAGSFVKSDVKYLRITNLDKTNSVSIYLANTSEDQAESVLFKLDARKSLMFSNAEFNASQVGDYVENNILDEQYYSIFESADVIKAKADSAPVQIEYFIASS